MPGLPVHDELCVRLAPQTRAVLEDIKRDGGFASDADAIRAALALLHHIARRRAEGLHLFLGGPDGGDLRELGLAQGLGLGDGR